MITEAHIDYRQREREIARMSLPDQLLATGAMTGPHLTPRPATVGLLQRIRRAVRCWLINRRGVAL